MTYKATKIVIITEKLVLREVIRIIEGAGATGYTIVAAGGKGSRGMRSTSRPTVVDEFGNVKIEVITTSRAIADRITEEVAARLFENYSGITYLEEVEVLRSAKF